MLLGSVHYGLRSRKKELGGKLTLLKQMVLRSKKSYEKKSNSEVFYRVAYDLEGLGIDKPGWHPKMAFQKIAEAMRALK